MNWQIPLFSTNFGPEEEEAVLRPLRRAWLTMGEEVERLEAQMCEDTGARHAIAVTNCTAALHLVGAALGLGAGDEVLCPSLTFVASASAFRATGASVRFCDIVGPDDWTIDPAAVEAAVGPATRAVVVVHYAGFPCRMDAIMNVARRHRLFVIEDCAHALYTRAYGSTLGLLGDAGCFSFYSNKNATCGEGGAVLLNDDALARQVRLLRSHGMTAPTMERHKGHAFSYDVVSPGFNCRMDEIRAALMQVQLRRLPEALAARRRLFRHYARRLEESPVGFPLARGRFAPLIGETGVHIAPVLLPPGADRAAVMGRMKEAGIQTSIHYPPIHRFTAYRGSAAELPRTDDVSSRELTLPLFPAMTDEMVDRVADVLLAAL